MNPIRILHLEDSPIDAKLIQRKLQAGGLDCAITHVDSRTRFESALDADAFQVVLCDYNLPNYDGISALKLVREKHPSLPVMLISGSIGEEDAVKCLQHGATDYLLKQRLDRLPAAVTRALAEADEFRKHRQAEEQIREQAALLDQARDAIYVRDLQQRIVYWNKGAERLYGWMPEEVIGKRADELFSTDSTARHDEARRLILEKGEWMGELQQSTRNGQQIIVESRRTLLHDSKGDPKSVLIINTDITEKKQAALALAESDERFRQLAEQSSEVFWFVSLNPQRVTYLSPAVEKVLGLSAEQIYQNNDVWMDAIHTDDQENVRAAWKACLLGLTPRFESEYRIVRKDRSVGLVLATGTPIRDASGAITRVGGTAKDITERKRAESQMLRTQRLESIGTLAGGVAHDLNNALAPILMSVELLRMEYPDASKMIDMVETSAKRGADMVRQLLTFAKGVEGARLLIQPTHLLKEMEKIIRSTFPKNIQLRASYACNLQTIIGDTTQLHQVLLNLCVNARDAMPNGGTLTLAAENTEIDEAYASSVAEARPGNYVLWRITDTGTGIPPEIIERIFEPFFSTKGPDKGTGLGLSTVIGIVKSHSGFVRVYSVPNQGTTFSVFLPAAGADTQAEEAEKVPDAFCGNGETILVADDEQAVRMAARAVLTSLNFKVATAADGTEALIQVAEKRNELKAVITDLHMPHMDGLAFVRALKRMLPDVGIIIASGRLDEREAKEFKSLGVNAVLEKPFTQDKLVEALKTVFQK
ncbi:MAG: multi-sensor hybrid histidine kinase [Verrucomicrobia bacterium]|nr:multi-sensor hybrid histidine kinase [Verrucomicrobiota bacterium]